MKPEQEPDELLPGLPVQLDACRPGSDDVRLPDLRELAVAARENGEVARRLIKSHRIDSMIGQAIRDVDVPVDLESRILSRLSIAESPSAGGTGAGRTEIGEADGSATPDLGESTVGRADRATQHLKWSRRRMAWIAVAASAAAVVVGLFSIRSPALQFSTQEDVARHAERWLHRLDSRLWKKTDFPSTSWPHPMLLGLRKPYQWQAVSGIASPSSVVCFELTPSTHLFVCRGARAPDLTGLPPLSPRRIASGWHVGGWQSEGKVYVLAVRGNLFDYQSLVKPNQKVAAIERSLVRA